MASERQGISTEPNGLLDLFDLSLLWRRKWSLLFSVLVAAGVATAYIQQQTPIYEVSSRVLVQRERFATDQERLVRTDSSFLATQGEILRSPVVVQPALQRLQAETEAEPDFEAANAVIRTLRVSSVDDANVLKLTYRSPDSKYAIRLLHAIVETFRDYSKEMQHGGFAETLNVLAQQDAELRKELEELEERYYLLRRDSPLIGQGKEAFSAHLAMLEQLSRRLTEARSQRIDKETQMQTMLLARDAQGPAHQGPAHQGPANQGPAIEPPNKVGAVLPTPGAPPSDPSLSDGDLSTTFVALEADDTGGSDEGQTLAGTFGDPVKIQEELWRAEMRATETSQVFGSEHPETRAVEAQIAIWRQRLQEYKEAAPVVLSQQLVALQKNETHLTEIYDAEFQKVKLLDSSLLKERNALAEIERVQGIHDLTATQLRELEFADEALANGQITTMVRMLEAPDATEKLVWPRPSQFIALCSALGFIVGCVVVTLAERVTKQR